MSHIHATLLYVYYIITCFFLTPNLFSYMEPFKSSKPHGRLTTLLTLFAICFLGSLPVRIILICNSLVYNEWGRPHTTTNRTSQPGIYYPHGYIIMRRCHWAVLRPGSSCDTLVAFMTSTSESRLGALRKA